MKILVVHRQNETVEAIKSVLSGCNPVVRNSESGLDGLLTSRIEHFDLIICGTDLPVVTGFELVRSIRNHSRNNHTPVIFISEKLEEKMVALGNSLAAIAMLTLEDIESKLYALVVDNVKSGAEDFYFR
jgi:CheY-like chemotaxis protein